MVDSVSRSVWWVVSNASICPSGGSSPAAARLASAVSTAGWPVRGIPPLSSSALVPSALVPSALVPSALVVSGVASAAGSVTVGRLDRPPAWWAPSWPRSSPRSSWPGWPSSWCRPPCGRLWCRGPRCRGPRCRPFRCRRPSRPVARPARPCPAPSSWPPSSAAGSARRRPRRRRARRPAGPGRGPPHRRVLRTGGLHDGRRRGPRLAELVLQLADASGQVGDLVGGGQAHPAQRPIQLDADQLRQGLPVGGAGLPQVLREPLELLGGGATPAQQPLDGLGRLLPRRVGHAERHLRVRPPCLLAHAAFSFVANPKAPHQRR